MKTIYSVLLCIVLIGCQKSNQETVAIDQHRKDNPDTKAPKTLGEAEAISLAKSKWGRNAHGQGEPDAGPAPGSRPLVSNVQLITSSRFSQYLPNCQVFRVPVYNPISVIAGQQYFPHAMVIQNGQPCFIDSDKTAADLVGKLQLSVTNEHIARDVVLLFADLRDYKLTEKIPKGVVLGKNTQEDWSLRVSKSGKSWTVFVPFLSDPNIQFCGQWKIVITPEGAVKTEFVKRLSGGGYQ